MSSKRKKPTDREGSGRKAIRKVVIDDDDNDDELQDQTSTNAQKQSAATTITYDPDEEVVAEVGVFLLSPDSNQPDSRITNSSVGINRLQFSQQHPSWLNKFFNDSVEEDNNNSSRCCAQYKPQVRHLKLKFGEEEQQLEDAYATDQIPTSRHPCGGGIADLLMNRPSSTFQTTSTISTSSSTSVNDGKNELFTGEGYSDPEILSNAVGFFKEGKLFLLPVDKTYEMRKPLAGMSEKEAAAKSSQKVSTSVSGATKSSSSASNLSPLRIRFARAENEMQRKRREQSAFYKQKLVEQDHWVPLQVEKSKITELYRSVIDRTEVDAQHQEQQHNNNANKNGTKQMEQQQTHLTLADLLL